TTVTSLSSGTWTAVTALDFASPNTGTAGALDGNVAANRTAKSATFSVSIAANSEIMLRWTKSGSNSHGLAIDDLTVTGDVVSAPTLATPTSSSITNNSVTLNETATSNGGGTFSAYGFEYSTTNGFADGAGTQVTSSNLSGLTYSANVTGLSASTVYYYKAYATNSAGTTYSSQATFTTATPTLTAGSLTAFGNVCTNTTTSANSFTISGTNLDNSTATVINVPTGFQISNNSSSGFASTYNFGNVSSISSTTLYVNFSPTAVQSYTNNITSTGGGAASISVSASGSGINTSPTTTAGSASSITSTSADVAGSISATGCTSVTAYGIEYSTTNGFTPGTGTQVSSSNLSGGNYTSALSGLSAGTTYYYVAYATNGGGTSYSTASSFNSASASPSLIATTLSAFSNTCINASSSANSFTLTGNNLDGTDVNLATLSGFSYCLTSNGTYTSTLAIQGYGTAINQPIYVKFNPTTATTYSGNISISGGNASSINVAASGTGIDDAPTVSTGSASNITTFSADLDATISSIGCSSISSYGIEYSTTNNFPNGTGLPVPSSNLSGNNFGVSLSGLNSTTTYYYRAYATNNGGTSFGSLSNFTTATPAPTATSLSSFNEYAGSTIIIYGTELSTTSSVTFGGVNALSFTVISNTQISAVVGAGASGNVVVTTTGGTTFVPGFTFLGYITNANGGDYNTASTWLNNGVPPANADVTIANTGITISGASNSAATLTINSGADLTFASSSATLAVTSSLTNNGTLTFTAAGTLTITAPATFTNTGTFTSGTGTVIYNGSAAQTITALNYNNLTINGTRTTNNVTLDNAATTGINGTLALNATYTSGSFVTTGTTIDFTSSSAQTIPVATYNNLSNSGNGARTLANGTIKINGAYSPTSGTITVGTSTVDFAGAAGQVIPASYYYSITNSSATDRTWASSGIINIKNTFSPTSAINTITGSTIQYSAASTNFTLSSFTTNVSSRLYNNLIIGEASSSAFFSPASGNNIGVAGNLTILGSTLNIGYSTTASTMTVDGDVTVTGGSLVVCSSSSANSGTLNVYGNIILNGGAFTRGQTVSTGIATINLLKASGTQTFTHSSGTVSNGIIINVGNGTTTTNTLQLLSNVTTTLAAGSTYPTLNILNGSAIDFGTYTWGNSTPNGTFTLNNGANLFTANTAGLGATGSVQTSTKTFSTTANYTFNGASAQVTGTSMPATVNNLTINNTSGVSLSNATTISTALTLSSGILDIAANNLTVSGSISGCSASNYIKTSSTGQLKQTVGSAANLFPVGNNAYNPITLDNTGGTSDVYGIRVVEGPVNACLDVTKTINRSWMVSEAVNGGSNLSVVAQYNAGEENSANFTSGTVNKLALFINPSQSFIENVATQSGSNPYTFSASTFAPSIQLTGSQYFALGKDYAFVPSPFAPSLGTTTITNITSTSADLGATINNDNGYSITDHGTLYGSSSGISTANNPTNLGTPGTLPYTFTETRSSLSPQTLYYTRAYATNTQGNGYSPELTFYTYSTPVTSQAASLSGNVISSTQIDLSWTGATFPTTGATNKNYILLSAVSPNTPTLASTNGQAPSAGANTTIVSSSITPIATSYSNTSLNVNTTYNYLLVPYTWDGTNAGTYNYLTASAPTCSGTTPDATLSTDYFKSNVTTGDWGTNASWISSHNGSANWITATATPTSSATSVEILNSHNITVNASVSATSINVNTGGTLSVASAKTLTITNSTSYYDMIVNGTISNAGTITLSTSVIDSFASASNYIHAQNGNSSNLTYSTSTKWHPNSNFEVTGWTNSGVTTFFGATIHYGNVRWNNAGQTSTYQAGGNLLFVDGNLRVSNSGSTSNALRLNSTGYTMNVLGDIIIDGGLLQFTNNTSATYNVNVGGSFNFTSGAFDFGSGATATGTINCTGTNKSITIASNPTNNKINWNINGSYTLNSDMYISNSRSLIVNGTLMCNNYKILNGTSAAIAQTTGIFTVASGATLGIGSSAGITTSGTTGNVQVSGTRTFNTGANYIYNGTTNQSVGNGLPATVNSLQINNTGSSSNNIVTLSNQDVTTTSTSSNGALQLTAGYLDIQARKIEIPNNGYLVATAGNFVSTNSGGTIKFVGAATIVGTVDFNSLTEVNGATQFSTASTINNTLQLNNGASVITNAPTYGTSSTLKYNNTGTISRGLEWSATSGAGYPYHVQISNTTTLNLSNLTPTISRTIAGDLTIDAASKLNMNTSGDQMQADLTVAGNINLNGTLELSALSSAPIKVSGNWVRVSTANFIENGSPVVFNGINPQTIQITGGGTEAFDNLVLNNTSTGFSSGILLGNGANATNLDINSTLTLTSGKLNANGNEVFIKNDATNAISGFSAMHSTTSSSFVIGNLRRRVSTTTMGDYTFPLGTDADKYEVAKITINSNADVDNLMANFTEFNPSCDYANNKPNFTVTPINGGIPTYVDDMLNFGYYIVEPYDASKVLVSSPTINYDATMTFNGHGNGVTSNALAPKCYTIIKRSSSCTGSWSLAGGSLDNTTQQGTAGSSSTITAKLSGLTSFSQFGAGFNSQGNVLPVELTEFNAALKNNNAELKWITASERNCDKYEIERSTDGIIFEKAGEVKAAGNSNSLVNYNFTDKNVNELNAKVIYYRLRQVDVDGTFAYSQIKSVSFNKSFTAMNIDAVYPNPFIESIKVKIAMQLDANLTYQVVDSKGSVIISNTIAITKGESTLTISGLSELSQGIYLLRMTDGENTHTSVIQKQ
ncbi:MAG: hypothetical protein RL065_412, partial [Bacteroidota bacterium]